MPDITVQFEFGSEGSLSKSVTGLINAEIDRIQSGILDKPLMLKFDIDQASLSNIRSKIADMALELGASFGGAFGGSVSSPVSSARSMAEATRNTTTAIQKQIESLVGLDKKAKSAEQSATAMERAWLRQREQAVKQEAKAVEKAEAEKAKAIKKYEKDEQKAREKADANDFTKNLKARGDAVQALSAQYTKAQNALRNFTAAEKSNNKSARNAYESIGGIAKSFDLLRNQVKSGNISYEEYSQEFSRLKGEFAEQVGIIKASGLAHKSFGDTLVSTAKKFGQYFTATRLVMGAYRTMKQMVKETIAVNDAMTQLQIVTKASNREMASYSQTAFNTAKRLGTSVTDVISATTTYARLGYNTQDSGVLAELTTMLQSVGDIDASSAQSAVTAIVKAFDDIDVTNISNAMDKLVSVGNGAPISVSELAEGLNNASSALSAAGNSFDESVALLTSANTTIQDAAKSSTGLRTIAARIRNTKTELDALGETVTDAEYNNIVETLTNITLADGSKVKVSLKDANGELRSTYDIIKDIASVWKYMGANEQAALADTLAGTRQQNIFYSLVENFDEASNAMNLMSGSMGAMQRAYDVFLTSTTAHINQFKAAFSELSTDFIDTGAMNWIIDRGRNVIEIVDGMIKQFGALGSIISVFAGYKAINGIKRFVSAFNLLSKDKKSKLGLWDNFQQAAFNIFPNLTEAIVDTVEATSHLGKGAKAIDVFKVAMSGLWKVMKAHPILSIAAVLGIAYSLFDALTVSADEARDKLDNLKSEYSNNESELSSLNSELSVTKDRIDDLKAKGTLTLTERSELDTLQKQNIELERQKSILESIQKLKKQEIYDSFVEAMDKDVNNIFEFQRWGDEGPIFNSDRQRIELELNAYKRYVEAIAKLDEEYLNNPEDASYQSQRERLDKGRRESLQYLLDKNEDFVEASKNISYIPDPKDENDRHVNEWLDYIGDFQDSLSMLVGDSDAKLQAFTRVVTTKFNDITAPLQELGKQSGVTAEMLQDPKYDDFIKKMIDLGVISGNDIENLQILADSFNNLGTSIKGSTDDGVISSFEALTSGLEEQSNRISTVQTAISESLGDTGLSSDSINNIKKIFSGLEGYDPSSLFIRTALGIKLNTNALQELDQEYQNVERQRYIDRLVELQNQYDRASEKLQTLKDDTIEYNNTIDKMEGLNNEINAIKDMVSQYDALYSAYNRWVIAKNQPHNRDSYEGVGASYDYMEQLIMDGWVGDAELGAYLDLMLGSSRTGDAINDWQKLGQTIEGTTHSLKDYWVTGENGNLQSDGLFTFLDDVNQKLGEQYVAIDALGNYKFDFSGDKLQTVAEAFGTSTDMILLFTQAMQDAGIAVKMNNLGDNTVPKKKPAEDEMAGSSENPPTIEVNGEMVDVDTSGVEPVEVEVVPTPGPDDDGDSSSQSMSYGSSWDQNGDGEPDEPIDVPAEIVAEEVDASEIGPVPVEIEPEVTSGGSSDFTEEIQDAVDISEPITVEALIDKQLAFASAEEMRAGMEQIGLTIPFLASVDPEQARAQLEEMSSQLAGATSENKAIKFLLSLDDAEMMAQLSVWRDQLGAEGEGAIEITPKVTSIDTSGIDPIEEDAVAKFTADMSAVPKHVDITGTVHFTPTGIPRSRGIGLADGTDDAKGGETLVGELGRELVVRDDRFQTVGDNGAELVNLKPGDIVFNHEDTEKILSGKSGARGTALANGTISGSAKAYASQDILGGAPRKTALIGSVVAAITGIGQSLKDRLAELRKKSDQEKKPTNGGGGGAPAVQDEKLEKVDWIERAIKKIEREIDKLKKTATSTFKSLGSKMTAASNEIAKITEEIELQGKAAERYRQEAESVELDEGLKQKVRDGTVDIQEYNEETRKLIDEYEKWYDKSTECEDALTDLHDTLATVYEDNFNAIKSDFDNQLGFIEHDAKAIEHNIDMLEAKGYMSSTRYYEQMQQNNRKTLDTLNAEMAALEQSLADAVSSGEIEEGSEAWYSMKNAVNETQEKIDDTNLSMQEIANTIRQIQWDYFDFGSQKISALADEAEFLINLMSGSELFDKQGKVSDTGLASMGLHGERYNVFMADADRYAEEIKKLDEEIANDPHNTTLLERRQELIDAQRESILTANDEKTAIRDLVKQGIDLELQAMQDLIDKYSESLDAAKDLYDYQKKVKSQADDIKNIQKQLAAYENDLSEEARAKVQKLTVSLQDAQDKLNETEYQQYIADQKKLLNNLYSDYEQVLNERLDDLDALVSDVIAQVNKSSADICDTLEAEAGKVGYSIEDATKNIWNGSSIALDGALTTYGNDFSAKLTGVNASLSNILNAVVAMAEHSNAITEGSIPRYKKGGLANYTGLAYMDGTSTDPEIVLDARDSANLIALRDLMRRNPDFSRYTGGGMPAIDAGSDIMRLMGVLSQMSESGATFGDTNIYIDIDHVENYNDFVNKLREDPNFDKMIRAMTTDRLMGGSPMAKTKYRW